MSVDSKSVQHLTVGNNMTLILSGSTVAQVGEESFVGFYQNTKGQFGQMLKIITVTTQISNFQTFQTEGILYHSLLSIVSLRIVRDGN